MAGSIKGREQRSYTETEKLAAISLAVLTSETQAGRELDIPRKTIATWVRDAGGLRVIQNYLEEKALLALQDARRVTAQEWVRRIRELDDVQLGETLRAMLKEAQVVQQPAGASAEASVIMVQMQNGELIQIPRDDSDPQPT